MKILILLLALLATTNYVLAEEGKPPRCKDPTYACQDLWTARTCGAVHDCIYDIWSTMKAPEDNNEICDICKEMVKEARDQLLSNETQEEIKEVFEGSCELLYIKVIVDECKKIFDDLIPDIIEMLASRMDPNTVCTLAGLCNNADLKGVTLNGKLSSILSSIPSALNDSVCDGCKTLLSAIKKVFTAIPQDEMLQILLRLCQQTSEFAAQCSAMVESYLPAAYDYILSMDPTIACESIGVCSESNEIKPSAKYGDELTCEFCETLVQYLRDIILTNSTKEEFRKALLNFCTHTGSFSAECKQLVNEYYDMIYDFIDKNLDPDKVCTALGLCEPSDKITAPMVTIIPMNNMWRGKHPNRKHNLLPAKVQNKKRVLGVRVIPAKVNTKKSQNAEERESTNEIGGNLMQQLPIERMQNPILAFTRDTECAFSKAIPFFLEKDIKQRNSKEITAALDNVCKSWLPSYQKECDDFISGNRRKVTELLLLGVSFASIPDYLNFCHDEGNQAVKDVPQVHENNGIICELCTRVMDYLKQKLGDKSTEEEIREALDEVCTYLPQSLEQDCQNFVNTYTDAIVALLLQEMDPSKICQDLGLCSAEKKLIKDALDCQLCKEVISYLKAKMTEPEVEDEIRKILDELCSILPKSWGNKCQQYVDQYANLIITLLSEAVDPDGVCHSLHICSGDVKFDGMKAVETKPAMFNPVKNSADCLICTMVMNHLEKELEDPTVESAIRQALDTVCSVLPTSYAVRCQQFVDKNTDKVIDLLVQNISPKLVCSLLQECPSGSIPCTLCQYALEFLQDQLMKNSTQQEIKAAAKKLCSYLPEDMTEECDAFIDQYGDAILMLLAQQLDPSLCTLFNVCPSMHLPKEPIKFDGMKAVETKPAIFNPVKDSADCEICTMVMNYLEKELEDPTVESAVRQALDTVCSVLPTSYAVRCQEFVDKYTDTVIQLLVQKISPKMVCSLLKECPSAGVPCTLCQYTLHFIQNELMSNSTESEIKTFVKKLCSYLPSEITTQCVAFIDQYGDALVVLLAQQLDPSVVCPLFGLCPSMNLPKEIPHAPLKPIKLDSCDICKTIVDTIDHLLEEGDVEKELTDLAAKVCALLPETAKEECNSIVHLYGPYILQMIGKLESGAQLCQSIDLCPRTPGHVHLIGADKCTFGPSYWCQSTAHAAACKAEAYCKQRVWKN